MHNGNKLGPFYEKECVCVCEGERERKRERKREKIIERMDKERIY